MHPGHLRCYHSTRYSATHSHNRGTVTKVTKGHIDKVTKVLNVYCGVWCVQRHQLGVRGLDGPNPPPRPAMLASPLAELHAQRTLQVWFSRCNSQCTTKLLSSSRVNVTSSGMPVCWSHPVRAEESLIARNLTRTCVVEHQMRMGCTSTHEQLLLRKCHGIPFIHISYGIKPADSVTETVVSYCSRNK